MVFVLLKHNTNLLFEVLHFNIILLTFSIAELSHSEVHNALVHLCILWSSDWCGLSIPPLTRGLVPEDLGRVLPWHGVDLHVARGDLIIGFSTSSSRDEVKTVAETRNNLPIQINKIIATKYDMFKTCFLKFATLILFFWHSPKLSLLRAKSTIVWLTSASSGQPRQGQVSGSSVGEGSGSGSTLLQVDSSQSTSVVFSHGTV